MREIKFRAWNVDEYISLDTAVEDDLMGFDSNGVDPYYEHIILEQSTGLKDKNGVEIYEGDIVENRTGNKRHIKFSDKSLGFVAAEMKDFNCVIGFPFPFLSIGGSNGCIIIGNIHDNYEILNVHKSEDLK